VTVAELTEPDVVVLVADAGLGTVNAVLLSLAPFEARRSIVILNRFDPADDLHLRNRDWLQDRHDVDVVTSARELALRLAP
jgi:dethiobiotin synthetase